MENDAGANGNELTLPTLKDVLLRFIEAASDLPFSIIVGVRSIPVADRATLANAQTTSPGPHATSKASSARPAPQRVTSNSSASSSRMAAAAAKASAWRVNCSTTIVLCGCIRDGSIRCRALKQSTVTISENSILRERLTVSFGDISSVSVYGRRPVPRDGLHEYGASVLRDCRMLDDNDHSTMAR